MYEKMIAIVHPFFAQSLEHNHLLFHHPGIDAPVLKNLSVGLTNSPQSFSVFFFLDYLRDGETLDVVSRASLNYFKKGWRKKDVPSEMLTSFTRW